MKLNYPKVDYTYVFIYQNMPSTKCSSTTTKQQQHNLVKNQKLIRERTIGKSESTRKTKYRSGINYFNVMTEND